MADKNIGSLPAAASIDSRTLLVAEQQGTAVFITGAQLKGFVGSTGGNSGDTSGIYVTDTMTLFAVSDSYTTPPTDGWSEAASAWEDGTYLWQKVIVTYSDGTMRTSSTYCVTGAQGSSGEAATSLVIESSDGTVFRNTKINTTLTVTVFKGTKTITSLSELQNEFGTGAYLEWSWKRLTDATFGVLLVTDNRIGDGGFTFTIAPGEVDRKVVLKCQLIT